MILRWPGWQPHTSQPVTREPTRECCFCGGGYITESPISISLKGHTAIIGNATLTHAKFVLQENATLTLRDLRLISVCLPS